MNECHAADVGRYFVDFGFDAVDHVERRPSHAVLVAERDDQGLPLLLGLLGLLGLPGLVARIVGAVVEHDSLREALLAGNIDQPGFVADTGDLEQAPLRYGQFGHPLFVGDRSQRGVLDANDYTRGGPFHRELFSVLGKVP